MGRVSFCPPFVALGGIFEIGSSAYLFDGKLDTVNGDEGCSLVFFF